MMRARPVGRENEVEKAVCGRHRSHCVGTGRPDADLEDVEDGEEHVGGPETAPDRRQMSMRQPTVSQPRHKAMRRHRIGRLRHATRTEFPVRQNQNSASGRDALFCKGSLVRSVQIPPKR